MSNKTTEVLKLCAKVYIATTAICLVIGLAAWVAK